jgi:hypothetical protein
MKSIVLNAFLWIPVEKQEGIRRYQQQVHVLLKTKDVSLKIPIRTGLLDRIFKILAFRGDFQKIHHKGENMPEGTQKVQWAKVFGIGAAILIAACAGRNNKRVYFGNLEDGSNVESPFKVDMKAENLIVEPAAMGVTEGHGHFHILVDVPLAPQSAPIPKDAMHIHYGDGQTTAELNLPVGQHTLILEFAKGDHVPYDPPVYQKIQINVTKQNVVDTTAKAPDTAAAKVPVDTDKTAASADTSVAKAADTASKKTEAKKSEPAKAESKKAP